MSSVSWIVLGFAYILGLLSTIVVWGKFLILALAILSGLILPRFWKPAPRFNICLAAGIIGLLAAFYFQIRSPHLTPTDISKFVPETATTEQVFIVRGKINTTPRLTRSGRSQFLLDAMQLGEIQGSKDEPANNGRKVTGKLYVTLPLLQATGLHPGENISIIGILYKPKPATNPGGFDFENYLAQEGIFAGFKGNQITIIDEENPSWGWWAIRQRIIRAQVKWLGVPEGNFVSAMVLGNRVVDLPADLSDAFIRTGLAHALAASGFQVSLILGVILALTKRASEKLQFTCGIIALIIFVGLTGLQPSVMRAVVMGFGGLIALLQKGKVKILGSLLVSAIILLIFNPLWIWDLSFQLSFFATLGLVVSATPISKKLDWIPPTIASIIAVPLAATLWTLPLQLYSFGVVSPYSILVNVIATIPISLISIGAFISAIAGVIIPELGGILAWILYYPTHILIAIVEFFSQLPGNSVAVGKIAIYQLIGLYGLICLVWWQPWLQKRWWVAGIMSIMFIIIPLWQTQSTLFRVTVLSTTGEPVMVIQDQGRVTLINSGDDNTVRFAVLPFLQQQGVNQIDWGIAFNSESKQSGWLQILSRISIKTLYGTPESIAGYKVSKQPLLVNQNITIGTNKVKLISDDPAVLELQIKEKIWLLLQTSNSTQLKTFATDILPKAQVLWWSGELLKTDVLDAIKPEIAIASSGKIDPDTAAELSQNNTKIYGTGKDGAVQWTPQGGFERMLETPEKDASML